MKRIALAIASASLLAASGGLALAQNTVTPTTTPGADGGASQVPNTGPAMTAPSRLATPPAAPASGSTEPQGVRHRRAGAGAANMGAADSADAERITRALNLLEANGYGGFTNFQPAAGGYAATVTKNGRQMNVTVNPDTGQVTPQAG